MRHLRAKTGTLRGVSALSGTVVQPSGNVGLAGIGIEQPFFKGLLDKLGVKANVIQRKEYKSAMENLSNSQISPANKEALEALLGSFFDQFVSGIAKDREIETADVDQQISDWMDNNFDINTYIKDQLDISEEISDYLSDNLSDRVRDEVRDLSFSVTVD